MPVNAEKVFVVGNHVTVNRKHLFIFLLFIIYFDFYDYLKHLVYFNVSEFYICKVALFKIIHFFFCLNSCYISNETLII